MRWYFLGAVIFGLSISDEASFAQGPPDGQGLSASRSTPQDAGFFATTGVVRFQLIQGRLCLDPPRHRKGSQSRDQDGVYESITVTAERGIPSLHYICQTPQHQLTLSVQQSSSVRIESYFPDLALRSVIEQPKVGPIGWTVTRGETIQSHSASTLFHLRHLDPKSFDAHHGMLIERLLRGRSLDALAASLQGRLLRAAEEETTPSVDAIRETIGQLGAKRRPERMAAQQRLLKWGTSVIPVIQQYQRDDLDAEQYDRLRTVLRRLRVPVNDTPASLAMLLVNDEAYWGLITPRLEVAQRRIADQHLQRIGVASRHVDRRPEERLASASE